MRKEVSAQQKYLISSYTSRTAYILEVSSVPLPIGITDKYGSQM